MHDYGEGVIAYFGDVNAEDHTIELVAAFVESRSPRLPIDCFSELDQSVFTAISRLKEEGNAFFKEGMIDEALLSYKLALEKFGHKIGTHGPQRECHIALWSNLTLMYMKKEDFHQAESSALKALELEWDHSICSYNLAKARLNISRTTRGGDLVRLHEARRNLISAERGNATRKLLCSITDEIERLEKKKRGRFGAGIAAGFATAMSGKSTTRQTS
jgi:tetratricopeptide (TPR) repeat protein